MGRYYLVDSEGYLVGTGECQDFMETAQGLPEGLFAYEGDPPAGAQARAVEVPFIFQRAQAYPDFREFLDAQVKLSSADPAVQAEGQAQLAQYMADCLAVKARYPKPEEAE